MIEITYADMFLLVVIVVLLWKFIRAKAELHVWKRDTMAGLYAVYEGEAEIIINKKEGSIAVKSKEKVNV
jgi:hypothetical protein